MPMKGAVVDPITTDAQAMSNDLDIIKNLPYQRRSMDIRLDRVGN